ncbi:MAG: NYN domain-containing protein [bacterium]|nr:NYN domain-containing protein [bacterium]
MEGNEKRLAVLIDSENVSSKYIKYILDEISNYGVATYKRIYGDWTNKKAPRWEKVALENSLTPIQQYVYTKGKNATDSAMIIDAMDILYSGNVDGFCLVSSDSDFTRLASRLRESGMLVIGMGEQKTNEAFIASCTLFKYLEILAAEDTDDDDAESEGQAKSGASKEKTPARAAKGNFASKEVIEETILKIIADNDAKDKVTTAGEVGSKLNSRYPDFDVRNYGYSQLSQFLRSCKSIEVVQQGKSLNVRPVTSQITMSEIEATVRDLVFASKDGKVNMSEMKRQLEKKYKGFNIRDYKYSKFSQFIEDMSSVTVKENHVVSVEQEGRL